MTIGKVGAVGGPGGGPGGAAALEAPGRTGFRQVMKGAQEGARAGARGPGIPVSTEGAPGPGSPVRPDAARGVCEARGEARAPGGRVEVKAASGAAQAERMLDRVGQAQRRMDRILELAESGRSFSTAELLAFQAQVYQASQELDLAGKVVEKAAGGVKQVLQTQV